jgi:hypothetical protein
MSKTPEELAEEFADSGLYRLKRYVDGRIKFSQGAHGLQNRACKYGFLAGYQAAKKEERLKLAELYSHGSDVQKIASAYFKSKGITGALLPYAENRFIDGYLAAQEHAHAALEEAEAKIQELQDQLADVSKVMPDTCEHILDMEKMEDVNGQELPEPPKEEA